MKETAPQQIAGLPFVAQVPFSHDDLDLLNRYVSTRKDKVKTGKSYIFVCSFILAAVIWLQLNGKVQVVLASIGIGILFFSIILCLQFTLSCRRQQKIIEADLEQGYLLRFEGQVADAEHWLVKSALLKSDANRVQKVYVLPVSGKIHRTNNSQLWTWFSI